MIKNHAIDLGEQREIPAHPNVLARVYTRADLANENAARGDELPAVHFHTTTLRIRIATVACAACAFFVSHGFSP